MAVMLFIIVGSASVSAYNILDKNQTDLNDFNELDINNDSKLDMDEFEELIPFLMSDSFWDGYSELSVLINEFERIDGNHDGFIDFKEYKDL